jgi:hypothetical protein
MTANDEHRELVRAIGARLAAVRARIAAAAERAGRPAGEIELVAVTKTHPPEAVRALFESGHRAVGENRVQELIAKMDALGGEGEWHLIGHLQRNKAAAIVGRAALIHSVDSVRLIEELNKRAEAKGVVQRVLLEINVAGEANKTGAEPEALGAMIEALAAAPNLRAEGLMTMAPYSDDPEAARPHFARLRELPASIPPSPHFRPIHLSMGMSGDFEVAIEEGATIVRIGTAILGERSARG